MADGRLHTPATARNREPILNVLRGVLPERGLVLEIASGSGEHAVYFAAELPHLVFQPTDQDPAALRSIKAWAAAAGLANVLCPVHLDVTAKPWPIGAADAIICINMVHISPWTATLSLFEGAAEVLPPGAPLYLYGAYKIGGAHTAPSNEEFDRYLRALNADWGVRDLEEVTAVARVAGFEEPTVTPMPANNLSVVFRRG